MRSGLVRAWLRLHVRVQRGVEAAAAGAGAVASGADGLAELSVSTPAPVPVLLLMFMLLGVRVCGSVARCAAAGSVGRYSGPR
ncbi:hypothetical protein ASF11_05760 [Acidovorax sp. Leaf76]|nr:hypothetical protein ASF11_05760 [Acidovorax sp. Leaf76]KQO34983.1 hypothetical protein ASF19_04635 [Acidovorax sp. Leaf84]KQS34768.1 hypothetical protein ASG27_04875 [Acidovorax sp. Leaf191]